MLDHNLCHLWSEWGLEEDMIPEDLCLTAEALAQVKRLCQWTERQVAELEQVTDQVEAPPQPSSAAAATGGHANRVCRPFCCAGALCRGAACPGCARAHARSSATGAGGSAQGG